MVRAAWFSSHPGVAGILCMLGVLLRTSLAVSVYKGVQFCDYESTTLNHLMLVYKHFKLTDSPSFSVNGLITQHQMDQLSIELNLQGRLRTDPMTYLEERDYAARGAGGTPGELPEYIHMTVKDKATLSPVQVASVVSWLVKNPNSTLLLYNNEDIHAYVEKYFPSFVSVFDSLPSPVERSDAWRYLVLCGHGGVYSDSDVICKLGVHSWRLLSNRPTELLVGIENAFPSNEIARARTYARRVQFSQWTIASQPGNAVTCRMANYIRTRIAEEQQGHVSSPSYNAAVLERTGPGIWSDSVATHLRENGLTLDEVLAGKQVGDVHILPQKAFGCSAAYWNETDKESLVYHAFSSSWKQYGRVPPQKAVGQTRRAPISARPPE